MVVIDVDTHWESAAFRPREHPLEYQSGGGGVTAITRLANTQRIHVAENLLGSMLYGGVFHRHPNLTVVLE